MMFDDDYDDVDDVAAAEDFSFINFSLWPPMCASCF